MAKTKAALDPDWLARVAIFEIDRLTDMLLKLPETEDALTVYTAKGIAARLQRANAIVRRITDDEWHPDTIAGETAFLRDSRDVAALLDNPYWRERTAARAA